MSDTAGPIVFFDGFCGLCNGFVDWLLLHDTEHRLRFAPLQGTTAKRVLGAVAADDPQSVVLLHLDEQTQRSAAVAAILKILGHRWAWLGVGLAHLPAFLADTGYDLVARYRYVLFGKRAACRLPTPAERKYFLD